METSNAPTQDRWTLGKLDPPSARASAASPHLRNMDSNAVFRLLVWRRRLAERGATIWALAPWVIITLVASTQRHPISILGSFATAWILFLLIRRTIWNGMQTERFMKKKVFLSIPPRFLDDLSHSTLGAVQFAAGLWGSSVTRREWLKRVLSLVALFTILWIGVLWPDPLVAEFKILYMLGLIVSAEQLVEMAFSPYVELRSLASTLDHIWNGIQAENYSSYAMRRVGSDLLGLTMMLLVLGLLIVPPLFTVNFVGTGFNLDLNWGADLTQYQAYFVVGLFVTGGGGGLGLIQGVAARAGARDNFNQMRGQIASVLDWMSFHADEAQNDDKEADDLLSAIAAARRESAAAAGPAP